ncbi:Uncharacterised protein [Kluyvera cryocrescens]|uniref:Uncharacterized protein n=1 Tax=Kluyvera cryocrescens TaxID=580 RepID=A0A485B2W1_KLUCR|nr:Uncharacterised protein [Kluyvera cryocrescens]
MNGKPLMLLTQGDLDEGDDLTLDQAAQRVLARMETQRTALRDQYDSSRLALSALKTVAGLLGMLLLWYGAYRSWRGVRRFYQRRIIENRSWVPLSWRRFIGAIETRLYALLMILLAIVALYVWLSWAFSLFPWTRVWGRIIGRVVYPRHPRYRHVDCLGSSWPNDCSHHCGDYRVHPETP